MRGLTLPCSFGVLLLVFAVSATAEPARKYDTLRWSEDWSWVGEETPATADAFDSVKNVPVGKEWSLTWGGSARLRSEWDDNRTLGASSEEEDWRQLIRAFSHVELRHHDAFRFFGEVRWSDSLGEDRPAGAIFRDDVDVQNFFLEFTAAPKTTHPITFRAGRQELLFGAQRLVSPLDWSSTRRTFDGMTVTIDTPRTETVLFATYPVTHEIHDIDSPIDDQLFWGAHATFRPSKGHQFEAYAYLQDDDRKIFMNEAGSKVGELDRQTVGARYLFGRNGWKVDVEGAIQSGNSSDDDISASMGSLTVGYEWKDAKWKPALEGGFDYATGDGDSTDGEVETFNQLFPLGHAYFGHVDLVARQNIEALRAQIAVAPTKRLKWVTALHLFELENAHDALYDAGGAAIRRDATGNSSDEVATELDVLLKYSWGGHHSVAFEAVRWWSDDFIENTGDGDDAWFAWLAYEFKF